MAEARKTTAFEDFLRRWVRQRLPRANGRETADALLKASRDLSEQAMAAGFAAELQQASRPYRTMSEYVNALHGASEYRDGPGPLTKQDEQS